MVKLLKKGFKGLKMINQEYLQDLLYYTMERELPTYENENRYYNAIEKLGYNNDEFDLRRFYLDEFNGYLEEISTFYSEHNYKVLIEQLEDLTENPSPYGDPDRFRLTITMDEFIEYIRNDIESKLRSLKEVQEFKVQNNMKNRDQKLSGNGAWYKELSTQYETSLGFSSLYNGRELGTFEIEFIGATGKKRVTFNGKKIDQKILETDNFKNFVNKTECDIEYLITDEIVEIAYQVLKKDYPEIIEYLKKSIPYDFRYCEFEITNRLEEAYQDFPNWYVEGNNFNYDYLDFILNDLTNLDVFIDYLFTVYCADFTQW